MTENNKCDGGLNRLVTADCATRFASNYNSITSHNFDVLSDEI